MGRREVLFKTAVRTPYSVTVHCTERLKVHEGLLPVCAEQTSGQSRHRACRLSFASAHAAFRAEDCRVWVFVSANPHRVLRSHPDLP